MLDSAGTGAVVPFFVTRQNYIQKLHSEWIRGRSWPQALCIVNGITCGIITIEINWISHFNDILIYLDISWMYIWAHVSAHLARFSYLMLSHAVWSECFTEFSTAPTTRLTPNTPTKIKSSEGLEWSCRVSFPAGKVPTVPTFGQRWLGWLGLDMIQR